MERQSLHVGERQAVLIWTFASDWKPEPNVTNGLGGWEPVFHPVLANGFIYVPGAGGTVYKVDKNTGKSVKQINPFATIAIDTAHTYVSGPLSADVSGNIYYHYCPAKLSGSRPNSLKVRPITHGRSWNDLNWKGAGLTSFRRSTG